MRRNARRFIGSCRTALLSWSVGSVVILFLLLVMGWLTLIKADQCLPTRPTTYTKTTRCDWELVLFIPPVSDSARTVERLGGWAFVYTRARVCVVVGSVGWVVVVPYSCCWWRSIGLMDPRRCSFPLLIIISINDAGMYVTFIICHRNKQQHPG
ncbi:hypothetical protein QBC36DRAFT_19982 [Triangularia setosa]|uniref:Uncharacterized protein n=1 Tax=Triangularia setosa TaxID=2587417 RepID=A0AAN6W5E1_9PEZI|nr:hypothetical protein QBC36DRAFT_19982 [Podospora setosa]